MISIVCVYNKEQVFTDNLRKSVERQSAKCELIPVNNTDRVYKSAAEALNAGARRATGDYIMFAHQDVCFDSPSWLSEVEEMLGSIPGMGIAGVAGVKDENGVISNIDHCIPPKPAGNIRIDKPVKVQTLDECLVVMPRSVFNEMQFDEDVCDNWHLYAVDYSLSCTERGLGAYVLPEYLYHMTDATNSEFERSAFNLFSPGSLPAGYYVTLKKVMKKHKGSYNDIYTTCGKWNTRYPLTLQRATYILIAELLYYKEKLLK